MTILNIGRTNEGLPMYYVYIYLDQRKEGDYTYNDYSFTHCPIYVGKGKGKRINAHLKEAIETKGHYKVSDKIKTIQDILEDNQYPIVNYVIEDITEDEAFLVEWLLIRMIGRKDLKTGPLTNISEGYLPKSFNDKINTKMSEFTEEYFRIGKYV